MPLTVSIGTATFPDDADTAADLIHKSDIALYRAKQAGRNRVVTYSRNGEDTEK
jgi:diguanylate cyclase (GGDEF)-like protein